MCVGQSYERGILRFVRLGAQTLSTIGAMLIGCARGVAVQDRPPPRPLAITGGGRGREQAAVAALVDVAASQIRGLDVTYSRLEPCGKPYCGYAPGPDCFQQAGGSRMKIDALDWYDTLSLEPIDGLAAEERWTDVIPWHVLATFTRGGLLYEAPLLVERSNTLFYDKRVFAQNGLAPPRNIGDFFVTAEALKSKGITPLAVSAAGGWTIAPMLFDGVLLSETGPQFYLDY
jgi:hypothetical protein